MQARFPVAGVVLVAGIAASVAVGALGTGTARADDEAVYLADLQANGFTDSRGAASEVTLGRTLCRRLGAGETAADIAYSMSHVPAGATPVGHLMDFNSSYLLVTLAARDLCPQYHVG